MSSQDPNKKKKKKGRRPRHQNEIKFYHNPHSVKTQRIMNIRHVGLCPRCTQIIEWRKTYRKYKPLPQPRRCDGCLQKNIIRAYHTVCDDCAVEKGICPKCKFPTESVDALAAVTQGYAMRRLESAVIKEREKRTITRFIDRGYLSPEMIVKVIEDMEAGRPVDWAEIRRAAEGDGEEDDDFNFDDDADDDEEPTTGPKRQSAARTEQKTAQDDEAEQDDDAFMDFDEDEDEDGFFDYDDDEEEIERRALADISQKNKASASSSESAKPTTSKLAASSEASTPEIIAGVPVEVLAVPVEELRQVKPKDSSKEAQQMALNALMAQLGPEGVAAALRAMKAEAAAGSRQRSEASHQKSNKNKNKNKK